MLAQALAAAALAALLLGNAARASETRFEGFEHEHVCTQGASDPSLDELLAKRGVKFSLVAKSKLSVWLEKLECLDTSDWVGRDSLRVEIQVDGSPYKVVEVKLGKGQKYEFPDFEFKAWKFVRVVLFEKDLLSKDDRLGEFTISAPSERGVLVHQFTGDGGLYNLTARSRRGAALEEHGSLIRFHSSDGFFDLRYGDLCALAGDFFAGEDPSKDVIGLDPNSKDLRDRSLDDAKKKFEEVFMSWFKFFQDPAKYADKRLMVGRLLTLLAKERGALRRLKLTEPTQLAYMEHLKGLKTKDHVTNTKDNNFARALENEEPSLEFHSTLGFMYHTLVLRNSMYYKALVYNFDHFRDSNALGAWRAGHQLAMETAAAAHKLTGPQAVTALRRALLFNAMADHFATDQFSAGHMRTPRRAMFRDREVMGCSKEFVGLCANLGHDEDNLVGLLVDNAVNKRRGRKPYMAYGDKKATASENSQNFRYAVEFVTASIRDVLNAFVTGEVPSPTAKRDDDPIDFIPWPVEEAVHPPIFKKEGKKWLYRETEYGVRPGKYTAKWQCNKLLFADSIFERRKESDKLAQSVLGLDAAQNRFLFGEIDSSRDGQISLPEFGEWMLRTNLRARSVEGKLIIVRTFRQLLGDSPNPDFLVASDIDVFVASKRGGAVPVEATMTMRQFLLRQWSAIDWNLLQASKKRGEGSSGGSKQLFGVNWERVSSTAGDLKLQSAAEVSPEEQLKGYVKAGVLQPDAKLEDLVKLEKRHAEQESALAKSLGAMSKADKQVRPNLRWIGYAALDLFSPSKQDNDAARTFFLRIIDTKNKLPPQLQDKLVSLSMQIVRKHAEKAVASAKKDEPLDLDEAMWDAGNEITDKLSKFFL